jgi:molybdopterin molybdotransferase
LRGFLNELLNEIVVGRALDKNTRAAQADLSLVCEGRANTAGNRRVEIGVGENDVRIFAAELERNLFEKRSACLGNFFAGHRAAGKRDRVDLRMRRDRSADSRPRAMDDVENALWQTGFARDLAQHASRHWRELARFGDGGVADGNRRGDFPAQQIERKIPRRDQPGDAAWLAQRIIERDVIGDVRFRFGMQDRGCEKSKIADCARDVERTRERDRLTGIDRLRACKLLEIALDQISYPQQKTRAFACRLFGPIGKDLFSRSDREIDIAGVAVRHLRVGFASRRFNIVEISTANRLGKFAVDKILNLEWFRLHNVSLNAQPAFAKATAWQASDVEHRIRETGEGGIRTLGSLLGYGALAKRCFQPLSHLTKCSAQNIAINCRLPISNCQLIKFAVISEEEARKKILEVVRPLPARRLSISKSLDFFAADDYFARLPLPAFDNSAMDGYAVAASAGKKGQRLRVIGEQPAGPDRHLQISPGEAVRIFTGAPIPTGADAVVMQEDVTRDGAEIVINTDVEAGEFIRRRGCDLSEGQMILAKGERIRAAKAALLASQGFAEVTVGGEVNLAIISTGDELVKPGEKIKTGQIYDSNSVLLDALLERCRALVKSVEHCRDERESLIEAIKRGGENHILIITGGVSVGEHDLVRNALRDLGAQIDIWRVAIRPGKPFLFGNIDKCAVFGLPGNPVSAFVTFLQFVRPAILKMMGATDLDLPQVPAKLTVDLTNDSDRAHYVRGRIENGTFAPIGRQESHALFGLSQSNALLRVAVGESLKAGDIVDVQTWD